MTAPLRLFLALELPPEVRSSLEEMQRKLKKTGADVRWVRIPAVHLTLKFLGSLEAERVGDLAGAVREAAAESSPLVLRLRAAGFFPRPRNARVVWAGLEGDLGELKTLARKVEAALEPLGFAAEKRGFRPHLTLGRIKSNRYKRDLIEEVLDLADFAGPEFRAKEVILFKSDLRPSGAVYTALERFPLSGTGR